MIPIQLGQKRVQTARRGQAGRSLAKRRTWHGDGPLIAEGWANALEPEAHRRELDTELVRRARVVVEDRALVLAEVGDIAIPIQEGAIDISHVAADLAELARGARVRARPEDATVFTSVGLAFEDLVVARAAVDRASG